MNSEKVKEIKEKLKKQYYYLDQAYSDHLAYGGKGDDKQEEEIYFLRDVLTLINEFESENEELKKYRCDWLNSEKMHLQADMEDTEFELASSNRILEKVSKENKTLKDRIAKLEKENKDYYDRLNNLQTYIDNHEEIWKGNTKIQLQQFAERLKEQMNEGEYMGKKYKLSVFRDIDIDEILNEFLSTTV